MTTLPCTSDIPRPSSAQRLLLFLTFLAVLLLSPWAAAQSIFPGSSEFLPPDKAFSLSLALEGDRLVAHWEIAEDHYLYRHTFAAEIDGQAYEISPPRGLPIEDEYFGKSEVFYDEVELALEIDNAQQVTLTWQGCADAGLCYPPQRLSFDAATLEQSPQTLDGSAAQASSASDEVLLAEDQQLASRLAGTPSLWVMGAFFGMGLLLTFTPCVLPMIPILSSLIIGEKRQAGASRWRGLMLSLAFVLPMAMTYAALGVAAAMAGANLQMLFQAPVFIGIFATIFVLLAMAMMGAFNLALPQGLSQRIDAGLSRVRGGRMTGAAAMGVLSAILVGPCMTAPLAGALLYIAETGNAWHGGLALLALGLGMGVPLVAVGTLGPQLLPRPGAWMVRVRILFGFVLLGMAIWFSERILPGALILALWGALLLGMAIALWHVARAMHAPSLAVSFTQSVAAILSIWGLMAVIGAGLGSDDIQRPLAPLVATSQGGLETSGTSQASELTFDTIGRHADLDQRLDAAAADGTWTMLEFTADWCISCKVIEREVFGDEKVQQALSDVQRLRIDVTHYDGDDREIMANLGIIGPPSILFYGPDSQERRHSRIIGELGADAFLGHLAQARNGTDNQRETP